MILTVTQNNFEDFKTACKIEPVFGSKCLCSYLAYNNNAYLAYNDKGVPSFAGYIANNILVMSCNNTIDLIPLYDFIKENGIKEIDTNLENCQELQKLLGGVMESSYYMSYNKKDTFTEDFASIKPCSDLSEVFSVLQKSHEYYRAHLDFKSWSEDINIKLEKKLLELYTLYDNDNTPIGTGCIVSQNDECAVVAAVAVIPAHRHKKLGSLISKFLTNRILSKSKTPKLISGYDEVSELYLSIGYEKVARWGELYL